MQDESVNFDDLESWAGVFGKVTAAGAFFTLYLSLSLSLFFLFLYLSLSLFLPTIFSFLINFSLTSALLPHSVLTFFHFRFGFLQERVRGVGRREGGREGATIERGE